MLATIIILIIIVTYSSLVLYKTLRNKFKGKCDTGCSGCSMNGACPAQSLSKDDLKVSLK